MVIRQTFFFLKGINIAVEHLDQLLRIIRTFRFYLVQFSRVLNFIHDASLQNNKQLCPLSIWFRPRTKIIPYTNHSQEK